MRSAGIPSVVGEWDDSNVGRGGGREPAAHPPQSHSTRLKYNLDSKLLYLHRKKDSLSDIFTCTF